MIQLSQIQELHVYDSFNQGKVSTMLELNYSMFKKLKRLKLVRIHPLILNR